MKKITAILLVALFLTLPVLAGWEIETNNAGEGGPGVAYTFQKYAEKPVIDGKLDEYGYAKIDVQPGDLSYAYNDSTDGGDVIAKGLSFDAYASYDADYLYLFVSMDTKYYYADMDNGSGDIWGQSAIQVNLAKAGDEGTDRLEYGIGRNSLDGQLQFYAWAQHPSASAEFEAVAGTDFNVVLDGDRINYECRTPVETFLPAGTKLNEGDKISFCLVMAQCDKENGEGGTGGYLHTQIASGCTGNGKTAENFAVITLGAAMAGKPEEVAPAEVAPAEVAPAEEAPAAATTTTTAVKTGDESIIVLAVVMMVAAAGVVIFRKKIAVK